MRVNPNASPIALSTHLTGSVRGKVQFISLRFTIAYLVHGFFALSASSMPLQPKLTIARRETPNLPYELPLSFVLVGERSILLQPKQCNSFASVWKSCIGTLVSLGISGLLQT